MKHRLMRGEGQTIDEKRNIFAYIVERNIGLESFPSAGLESRDRSRYEDGVCSREDACIRTRCNLVSTNFYNKSRFERTCSFENGVNSASKCNLTNKRKRIHSVCGADDVRRRVRYKNFTPISISSNHPRYVLRVRAFHFPRAQTQLRNAIRKIKLISANKSESPSTNNPSCDKAILVLSNSLYRAPLSFRLLTITSLE